MSELDVLVNAPATVEVAGVRVDVRPLTLRELPAFIRAAGPLVEVFNLAIADAEDPDLPGFLEAGGEDLAVCLAVASRTDPEWVAALGAGDALLLLERVLAANADFFVRAAPAILRVVSTAQAVKDGLGPAPGSPRPATGTKTS